MTERVEIVSDENVKSGDPCVAGTRIPAETIVANLKAGHPIDEIFAAYPTLPAGGIEVSIRWADSPGQ